MGPQAPARSPALVPRGVAQRRRDETSCSCQANTSSALSQPAPVSSSQPRAGAPRGPGEQGLLGHLSAFGGSSGLGGAARGPGVTCPGLEGDRRGQRRGGATAGSWGGGEGDSECACPHGLRSEGPGGPGQAYLQMMPAAAAAAAGPQAAPRRLPGTGPLVRRQSCPVRPRSHRLPPGSRSRAGSGADQEGSASRSPRAPTRLPVPHGFCSGAQPRHSPAAATLSRGRDESSECPRSCFPRCGQQRRQKPGNLLSRSEQVRPRGLGLAQTRPPPPRPGPANGRQGGREEEPGVRRGGAGGVPPFVLGFTWQPVEGAAEGGPAGGWGWAGGPVLHREAARSSGVRP